MGICNEEKEAIIDIKYISFSELETIMKQKECVCKIIKDDKPFGTGFFCKIPYNENKDLLRVLITCNHVLDNNDIKSGQKTKIELFDTSEKILDMDDSRITFTSPENEYDITIIEIKEQDQLKINYIIEIDENINIKEELIKNYKKKDIYLIHYPFGNEVSLSFNRLIDLDTKKSKIEHKCGTEQGSSGGPIFNSRNRKLIGIHTGTKKFLYSKINSGILINAPINEFIKIPKPKREKEDKFDNNIENTKIEEKINNNKTDNKEKINKKDGNDKKRETYNVSNLKPVDNKIIENKPQNNIKDSNEKNNISDKSKEKKEDKNNNNKNINNDNIIDDINKLPDNKNLKYGKYSIIVKIKIYQKDLYKDIFFLNDEILNNKNKDNKDINQNTFINNISESNTKIYLNDKEIPFEKYFLPEKEGTYTVKIEFNLEITDCIWMFKGCSNISNIDFIEFDTKNATSMKGMFSGCTNLESLDLSCFNTEKITDMSCMFLGCHRLKSLNISSFDTKNVIYMNSMFNTCHYLKSLNLSHFKTDKVINMSHMFCFCGRLEQINLSSFNTENVTNMDSMFESTRPWLYDNIIETFSHFESSLKNLDLTNFNTKNVTSMKSMFKKCDHLVDIKFSKNFNTEKVTDMSEMFNECKEIRKLDISDFNTKNVINMKGMFKDCTNLIYLNFSFDAENVTNMEEMFSHCFRLKNFELSLFNVKNIINISWMFSKVNLSEIDLSTFDTRKVQLMEGVFFECKNLKNINLSSFKTINVTNISYMFKGCIQLADLDLSRFEFKTAVNTKDLFKECQNLKKIKVKQKLYDNIKNQLVNTNIQAEIE